MSRYQRILSEQSRARMAVMAFYWRRWYPNPAKSVGYCTIGCPRNRGKFRIRAHSPTILSGRDAVVTFELPSEVGYVYVANLANNRGHGFFTILQ